MVKKPTKADIDQIRLGEVYIEYQKVGQRWRITAIDPRTKMEVTMVAAPGYSNTFLERLIMKKLKYAIAKHRAGLPVPQTRGMQV